MRGAIAGGLLASGLGLAACNGMPELPDFFNGSPAPATAAAPAAAPASHALPPARGDAIAEARRCGTTLGIAVRCNLLRDDRDFAVVRYAVLQGLDSRYGSTAGGTDLAEMLDLATLDRLTSIEACTVPPAEQERVARNVRGVIAGCTGESAATLTGG